ncbi:MAG: hypothetical protein K1X67_03850 [Fimbriimonadaceae bacterium]|nr:hypothetical protein [Fimbriimonadaceae bacterium]
MSPDDPIKPPPILQPPPVLKPPPARNFLDQVGDALGSLAQSVTLPGANYELLLQVREAMHTPGDPTVQYLKRTRCYACGASKTLAPKSAYVYCDFCGTLCDYDFQMACLFPNSAMPGPAYESLLQSMHAELSATKANQDVARYREIQIKLFTRWVELCPMAVSPRAKDPEYRQRLVAYMAEVAVTNDFDPTYAQYAAQVGVLTAQMRWIPNHPRPLADSDTFWPLYQTVKEQVDYSYGLLELRSVTTMHPDDAPASLQSRMTWSMFAQGWLPYLTPYDSEKLLLETGLYGEYSRLEPTETSLKHCGRCGGDLRVVPGARAVVCESCGVRVDVEADESSCANCAGKLSFPVGVSRATCPYCRAEAIRMA